MIRKLVLATAIAVLAASGAQGIAQTAERFRVKMSSPALERTVAVGSPVFRPVGDFTMLQANVANLTDRDVQLEYRVEWFDNGGISVQTVSGWQPLFLSSREEKSIRTVGQSKTAHAAFIQFRPPGDK